MAAPSFDDYFNLGKAEKILRRPSLGLRIGDITEMLVAGAAAMADRVTGWFAERVAATFLDGATGTDLTFLAADHWGIQRRAATKSVGTVTFSRASANATAQNFPIGTVVATLRDSRGEDLQFVTTQVASWGISENGPKTVNAEAVAAGSRSNLAITNLVVRIVSTPPAGGTYTVTASSIFAGGSEEETDPELRDRVRIYPSTLRRGTHSAIEYGAKSTPTIAVAKASAITDSTGLVTVYVSDASGNSTGALTTVAEGIVDDGSMTRKVAIELLEWAPLGGFVKVSGGATQIVNITVAISVRLGANVAALISSIQSSVESRVLKLGIGDTLYLSDIINAVKAVDPDNIVNVSVVSPLTNTVPSTPGHLIRPGTITVA